MTRAAPKPSNPLWRVVRRFCLFVVLTLGIIRPFPVVAGPGFPNYVIRNFLVEDGLPEDSVTAVVQTEDGYIWLGTYSGLARFDGVHFTVFDSVNTPELASSRVSALFQDRAGNLWIGYESGELTRYDPAGHFHTEEVRALWKGRKISGISADESGEVWLMNDQGVLGRVQDGAVRVPEPGRASYLASMARESNGSIWVARDGKASILHQGDLTFKPLDGAPEDSYVQGLCPGEHGQLWVASKGFLHQWKRETGLDEGVPAPWEFTPLTAFVELKNGLLAVGTQGKGLYLVNAHGESVNFSWTNGLLNDWIRCLWADREGNLWVGTGGGGLAMLHVGGAVDVTPPDHWQGRPLLAVLSSRDGAVWVGTEGAGLYRFHAGTWSHFDTNDGLRNLFVWSLAEEAMGGLYAGTWGGGLYTQGGDHFQIASGLADVSAPMPALLPARGGGLWVGTDSGLLRYQGTNAGWIAQTHEQGRTDVRAIVEDSHGALWCGLLGRGLARWSNGQWQRFAKADGLSSDFVRCLYLDEDGVLWIGTFGGGVNRLKNGRFTAITTRQGLPDDMIGCILDDGEGNFWMSSHAGIIRVSREELNLCADGQTNLVHCAALGRSDGLPSLECASGFQPAGCKTPDGRLWFPTGKGLVAVDPHAVSFNLLPPPVHIETVRLDGQRVADSGIGTFRIGPGQHRIEIGYTALSFSAPEKVRFKYKLEGLDQGWHEAGSQRNLEFTYLPPGDYTFHVLACNNDGVWNYQGAEMKFKLEPYFWQTSWFLTLSVLAIAAGVGFGVHFDARRRMHIRLAGLERQRAIERERARIARDIHDDLGASLTRISLLSDAVPTDQVTPAPAGEALSQIFGISRDSVRALDEIVWAVNPKFDTLDSLANYLGNFAQALLETAHIGCRLEMPVQLPVRKLTTEVRHNVFLAYKEALNNILKHAEASEVRVSLALEMETMILTVQDNGRGFSPIVPVPASLSIKHDPISGNGLTNMRQRLAEVGGRCEIQSAPGAGSTIRFIVPFHASTE